ncbi:MAG TPA: glycerol-3-phosphate dehydrogenase/oxidase [Anaerolineae bacterium]|nr:glycerol-3-phosphate dehydrogenase/oxidase [Anaerolineae bacterium]
MPIATPSSMKDTSASRPFSSATRAENLEWLAREHFDILIIGGGITGCAAARDAAMRGYRVALVEKEDFASGTSSRSSRLIHGGLRYLEHRQFGLVRESVVERARLLRNASRIVKPLSFVYPVYRRRYPRYAVLSIGLWLYDLMSIGGRRGLPRHRMLRADHLAEVEPLVAASHIAGAGYYYDATTDDARLTLLTAKAAHHAGAIVANYAQAVGLLKAGSRIAGAHVRDVSSGHDLEVKARVVVNAAGPWVDRVLGLDAPSERPVLRPTKGAHLVVPRARLPIRSAIAVRSPRDRRAMFLVPWSDFAIVGTTDTDYDGRPEDAVADRDDCAYLLESVRGLAPEVRLDEADVISTYAGVRPLIAVEGRRPSSVSREHAIVESKSGLITIAGGKLTTHRAMAEQLVDRVQDKLLRDSGIARRLACPTANAPLAASGDIALPDLPEKTAAYLVEAYGADVIEVVRIAGSTVGWTDPIVPGLPYLRAEAIYAAEHEMAVTLCDFLMRRTHILHEAQDGALLHAGALAADMGAILGWDDERMQREVAEYEKQVMLARAFR